MSCQRVTIGTKQTVEPGIRMISIQKIIVERVLSLVRHEIKRYVRLRNDEIRKMQGELSECKRRLLKLEKYVEEESEKTIAHWVERVQTNGATLKTLRKKLGITQTELAILLDTNPATVNRWESGRVRLSRKSCEKIAKIRALSTSEAYQILQEKYMFQKKT
ncbi:MAG: helix-turn-helix transcriptional regulator [Victivallaceae bacterium]|nr:helix-turn-helix transcriptional regulator [Victivallaceae bacterium]